MKSFSQFIAEAVVPVLGKTFPVKDQLKELGAKYNGKQWMIDSSKLEDAHRITGYVKDDSTELHRDKLEKELKDIKDRAFWLKNGTHVKGKDGGEDFSGVIVKQQEASTTYGTGGKFEVLGQTYYVTLDNDKGRHKAGDTVKIVDDKYRINTPEATRDFIEHSNTEKRTLRKDAPGTIADFKVGDHVKGTSGKYFPFQGEIVKVTPSRRPGGTDFEIQAVQHDDTIVVDDTDWMEKI